VFNLLWKVTNRTAGETPCFPLRVAFSSLFILSSINVFAQDTSQPDKGAQETQEIERITVLGGNLDAAMGAFRAGNFALAEIEFKKNAKCALRAERNKKAFIGGLQTSSINSSIQNTASVTSVASGSQSQGNLTSSSSPFSGRSGGKSANQEKRAAVSKRTCSDRGYQMYMTALSQIQLGRNEEAEKNLKTASFLNKNIYDAHYRIALMGLLRKDNESAEDRLSDIQEVLDRCRDCEAREEIVARIDFLEKALSGEIKLH
jgi:hypothetical protein